MSLSYIAMQHQNDIISKTAGEKSLDSFRVGDTLAIKMKIIEGTSQRVTILKGVCVKKRNRALLSTFVVRKISSGIGVEKTIPVFSPLLISIEVTKRGKVRRKVLNYLRYIPGALKIKERFDFKARSKKKLDLKNKKEGKEQSVNPDVKLENESQL